mgnify:CR=1 FL=1
MTSASAAKRLFAARQRFKRANTIWAKGFTLIEVVIVAAIAGVLGATAIPQFLGTKDRAEQRATVAEAVGLAKECATAYVEGVENALTLWVGGLVLLLTIEGGRPVCPEHQLEIIQALFLWP